MYQGLEKIEDEVLAAYWDNFARQFVDKVARIHSDAMVIADPESVLLAPICLVVMDTIQFVQPEEDKIFRNVRSTTCALNPCPFGLIKVVRGCLVEWIRKVVNDSPEQEKFQLVL